MRTRTNAAVCSLLMVPITAIAQTQDLPYSSGSTGADGPLKIPGTPHMRYNAAAAYDAARDQIVLFSGSYRRSANNQLWNTPSNETYLFDGTSWDIVTPATQPGVRNAGCAAFDPVRGEVVMFGGYWDASVTPSRALADTWVWDGDDWSRKLPATSPPAGGHNHMVWDPVNDRILMFGGVAMPNGLWAWDGSEWSEITTATTPFPSNPGYFFNCFAFEESTGRAIAYNESARQTWAFDGTDWAQVTTTASPDTGQGPRMVWDDARGEIVLFGGGGSQQTWVFKDDDWSMKSPASLPVGRSYHNMVYKSSTSEVVLFCGDNGSWAFQDTDTWDGSDWTRRLGRNYTFDMSGRPDGTWHFTSIEVPPHVDVSFIRNSTNTPVTWLATEDVSIAGRILLNGQNGFTGGIAQGGPGGYNGGTGGVPGSLLGQYAGSPGAGPGGGAPGITIDAAGGHATHRSTYGNALVQPPTGGSGGGGGGSDDGPTGTGGNGGAGGGAIVIKTSRDFSIVKGNTLLPTGAILVNGGNAHFGGSGSWGGAGSAGSIRIVADRVSGDGTLQAYGGLRSTSRVGEDGWIRVESYFQPFDLVSQPAASIVSPVGNIPLGDQPRLRVVSIAGEAVPQPPLASIETPDVIFANNATPVSIVVFGDNVPAGTEITLTIETPSGPVNLPGVGDPAVTLAADGSAVFNTVLEDGHGTIRAFANYDVQP